MALAPGSSKRAKLDRTRSYFERETEYPLVTGIPFTEEGEIAALVNTGTVAHARPALGTAVTEVPLGILLNGTIDAVTFAHFETGVVPAGLTHTLKFNNLVTNPYTGWADAYVFRSVVGTQVPVVAPGAPGAGNCSIVTNTGVMTFDIAQLGWAFSIRYRWNMTVAQALAVCKSSPIGRSSEALYNKVVVGRGHGCRVFTTTFDAEATWTIGLQTGAGHSPVLGAAGVWTSFTNNNNGTPFGRVISLPTANDPYVGFEFNTP
jgi:hypothetical protein